MSLNSQAYFDKEATEDGKSVSVSDNNFLRSDNVQEIISRQPGFVERWALPIFSLVLLMLVCGTWFIKYPDVIYANATLTAANAPKEIVVRQDGKLVKLFVANDSTVSQGQMIGWIESTAKHSDVIKLSDLLNKGAALLSKNETETVSVLFNENFQNLGELQIAYQQFHIALQQFNDYLVNGYYVRRKSMLHKDQAYLQNLHAGIVNEIALTQQDILLNEEAFNANNSRYKDTGISKEELRDQKSKLIGKKLSLPQLQSTLFTNENNQIAKQKEVDELEHAISQQKAIFQQALQTLISLTDDWRLKHIITAPVDGKVAFLVPLQENQFMQMGKTVGYVNPPDSRYFAQVTIPQNNFGKIDIGQNVQLRFAAYPYQEFGFIPGRLNYISKVPSDSGFLATVELPEGLVTNYKKVIRYRNGLNSQALIVTKSSRLLQRFYYNIFKAVHQ